MRTLSLLATSTLVLGLGAGCVTKSTYESLAKAYELQRQHTQSTQATADRLQTQNEGLALQKDALEALLKKRESEMDLIQRELRSKDELWRKKMSSVERGWEVKTAGLTTEMQRKMAELAAKAKSGMEFDKKTNKLTLSAGVFFKSGSADVLPAARRTILEVCDALKGSGTKIHVVGHTDSDPLKRSLNKFPRGNWQLSSERALSVLLVMWKQGSIGEDDLSFEGRGKADPLESNSTASGKAKNRRVEIYLRNS